MYIQILKYKNKDSQFLYIRPSKLEERTIPIKV